VLAAIMPERDECGIDLAAISQFSHGTTVDFNTVVVWCPGVRSFTSGSRESRSVCREGAAIDG
jgi:hypothetical protein